MIHWQMSDVSLLSYQKYYTSGCLGSNKHLHEIFYQGKSAEKKQQHPQLFLVFTP